MAKKINVPAKDEHAASFFGFAGRYQKAANLLYASDRTLTDQINFLYSHAIELALKAFLRAHNLPIVVAQGARKHHRLAELYEECRSLGLKIGADDATNIRNIMCLLDGANKEQGLRYFSVNSATTPELSWTRDGVERLMRVVEPIVNTSAQADGIVPGRAVKLNMTFGKPETKDNT
jgi:hypothetical protein